MLNIGQAIKISDWTSKLIRLNGLRVDENIAIAYTETRAGEKPTESLVAPAEEVIPTPHPFIFRLVSQNGTSIDTLPEYTKDLILLAELELEEELASKLVDKKR